MNKIIHQKQMQMNRTVLMMITLWLAYFPVSPLAAQQKKQAGIPDAGKRNLIGLLQKSEPLVTDISGRILSRAAILVERKWDGDRCFASITNTGKESRSLKNIVLFNVRKTGLDPNTPIYGEGFQMLSQTTGTLQSPVDLSEYTDRNHYRLPEPDSLRTVYNLFTLDLGKQGYVLLGFTSSKRFAGRFSFSSNRLMISMDPEGLSIDPGEKWQMETFTAMQGNNRNELLARFAKYIQQNHPRLPIKTIPTGWCSWYCYGDKATKSIVQENLGLFSKMKLGFEYIQIDDGYSPYEGDWLDPSPAFGSMDSTVLAIRQKGFLPAIWVAPFIAEKDSRLFREHPGWFIKDKEGKPLNSATKGFGGWRHGPWYVLDGTNPDAQKFLEETFRTMREKWGIQYFKLDANYWGTVSGEHFDPHATRIEAYRRGMEAIIRGAGPDAILLGCNAPMWPSIGLVNMMRTSNDIDRSWERFAATGRENLNRNWQNGRLWVNDPDCLLLAGDTSLPDRVWLFHATVVHAVGGLVLSGDKAADLGEKELSILRKSIPSTGIGAMFEDRSLRLGITHVGDREYFHCFNWTGQPTNIQLPLKGRYRLIDYWSNRELGTYDNHYMVRNIPPQSAMLIEAIPVN
ncbi:MAG: alpha-galactosidase [Bacteroidota bacterium]|nr:alpha-galactosidase [Bacteroidota bacterium]MDP4249220.1 alpha-galactosidase [Bacteroidota bacterium]